MTDPVSLISPYLRAPEEPIQCAAARALGVLGDEDAAPALVDALLDPDPDVRADAMAALVRCARPQDAPAIRRSLQGDPAGDVKTAAVRVLGRLKDTASTELLRALAQDRCEPEVAWEEGSWYDRLDVQVAAITALGDMGAESAVDDLVRVRADEDGQELDHVVFAALAKMPRRGVAALLDFLRDGDARVRQRALTALSGAGGSGLTPLRDRLIGDRSAGVRRLAVDCLDADDPVLSALALKDPDPAVRAAALTRVAPVRGDIVRSALGDPEPGVRAAAVEALAAHVSPGDRPALAAKLEAWLRDGNARLAAACAEVLPKVSGRAALGPLRRMAADTEALVEVRIAALKALGEVGTPEAVDVLRAAAVDSVRQVRLAALVAAAALIRTGLEAGARNLLIGAMCGDLRTEAFGGETATDEPVSGAAVPGPGERGRIAIAPEGDIVPAKETPEVSGSSDSGTGAEAPPYPRSTLEAIQVTGFGAPVRSPRPPASPATAGRVRSRRVPVGGADDVDADIRLTAVRLAADCGANGMDEVLAETALSTESDLRAAVFEAIAQRAAAMPLAPVLRVVLARSLGSDDARVRCAAVRGLTAAGLDHARQLIPLLDDPDPSVRAAAVTAVAAIDPARAAAGFHDSSPLVRRAAVDAVIAAGEDRLLDDGLRVLVDGSHADSLMDACTRHIEVTRKLIGMLSDPQVSKPRLRTMLEALGGAGGE